MGCLAPTWVELSRSRWRGRVTADGAFLSLPLVPVKVPSQFDWLTFGDRASQAGGLCNHDLFPGNLAEGQRS
jgi:hypothetical protein